MEKEGFVSKIKRFFSEVRIETSKVSWPTRKEAIRYTMIVVIVSVVVAAILGGFDYLVMRLLIRFVL